MTVGQNSIIVPYKIDTGSDGKVTNKQLATTKNKHILLKMYNKTTLTWVGTCIVVIEHKNNKKKCKFFCSSWEWTGITGNARHRCTQHN